MTLNEIILIICETNKTPKHLCCILALSNLTYNLNHLMKTNNLSGFQSSREPFFSISNVHVCACDTNKSKEKKTDALAAGNSSALLWSLKLHKHQKSGEKKPLESHKEPFNYYITFMHEKKPEHQSTLSVKLKDVLEHYRLHSKTQTWLSIHISKSCLVSEPQYPGQPYTSICKEHSLKTYMKKAFLTLKGKRRGRW